jgi:hypothetical protein
MTFQLCFDNRFRAAEKGGIDIEEYLDILREFAVGLAPRR